MNRASCKTTHHPAAQDSVSHSVDHATAHTAQRDALRCICFSLSQAGGPGGNAVHPLHHLSFSPTPPHPTPSVWCSAGGWPWGKRGEPLAMGRQPPMEQQQPPLRRVGSSAGHCLVTPGGGGCLGPGQPRRTHPLTHQHQKTVPKNDT